MIYFTRLSSETFINFQPVYTDSNVSNALMSCTKHYLNYHFNVFLVIHYFNPTLLMYSERLMSNNEIVLYNVSWMAYY